MAQAPIIRATVRGSHPDVEYEDSSKGFHHAVKLHSRQSFSLQEIIVPSGPHAGMRAFVLGPSQRVSLDRHPLELRHMIYKHCLTRNYPIHVSRLDYDAATRKIWGGLNVLLINRQFGGEAREFLYRDHQFIFDAMSDFCRFMRTIRRSGAKFLTHITVRESGFSMQADCYTFLKAATTLKTYKVTFCFKHKGSISSHVDKHYADMKIWLLHGGVGLEGALERLRKVTFDIGASQQGVLDNRNGAVIKVITPELNRLCLQWIGRHLLMHFGEFK